MHCVRVQVPLGVAPFQVMVPVYPGLHAHARPATLVEFAMVHGAAVEMHKYAHVCVFQYAREESAVEGDL